MALLIYALVASLLTVLAVRARSKGALFFLQLLPILFLPMFLWSTRENYRVLQVRKIGYEFDRISDDYRNPARTVTIGGDRQVDQVYAPDLPPGAVRITPSLVDRTSRVEVDAAGVLLFRNRDLVNSCFLNDGDVLARDGRQIAFHAKGPISRSFQAGTRTWDWPRKPWKFGHVKQPFFIQSLESEYFFLSDIDRQLQTGFGGQAAVSKRSLRVEAGRQPLQLNRVVLSAYDPAITVNGARPPAQSVFLDGDVLKIYALQQAEDAPARPQLAAAFRVRNSGTLSLVYVTPQTLGMDEDLFRQGTASNKPLLISTSSLPYSVFPTAHYSRESKTFSDLTAFVQTEKPVEEADWLDKARQAVMNFFAVTKTRFEVVTEDGTYRPKNGEVIGLGRVNRMMFTMTEVRFPWLLLQGVLILFLLKTLFQAPFYSPIDNLPAQLILVNLDFFLVTRVLFAFRAAVVYPFSTDVLPAAMSAVLFVPLILFLVLLLVRGHQWRRAQLYNFLAYSVAALAGAWIVLPDRAWIVAALVLAAGAAAFLRFHPKSPLPRLLARARPAAGRFQPWYAVVAVLALALLLQLLTAGGEALRLAGIRFPLALLYHPVLLVLSCHYVSRLRRQLQQRGDRYTFGSFLKSFGLFLAVLAAFFVVGFLTSDFGFFLLYCLPVLLLLGGTAWQFFSEYEMRWKGAGALLLFPLAVFFLIFSSDSTISRVLPRSLLDQPYVQRILLAVNPSILEQSGVISSERQLGHKRTFLAYAHSGVLGGGYMKRPVVSSLSATALNDNVPSVFLLNDFGALGLAAVLLILALWAWLWYRAAPVSSPPEDNRTGRLLSLAALLTVLFADLYMILANAGVFLFTGKNVFLWGLNSNSDLLHTAMLFSFLLAPLAAIRPMELEKTDPTLSLEKLGIRPGEEINRA